MPVQWWGTIPFVVMLLAIAVLPLVTATAPVWERNSTKWGFSAVMGAPVAVWLIVGGDTHTVVHSVIEYSQFILLLGALYVITGGIHVEVNAPATPRTNTIMLALGALLASFLGTTGAAMILIRTLLRTNRKRSRTAHTVVFAIFIVANSGGLLTPLGDPPLFMGFLRGVPFWWTLHLAGPWLFVNGLLLAVYWSVDKVAYARESPMLVADVEPQHVRAFTVSGLGNLIPLTAVIVAAALIPSADVSAVTFGDGGTAVNLVPWRELVLIVASAASYLFTPHHVRWEKNQFRWNPIVEVAAIFLGIFLTMIPALAFVASIAPRLQLNAVTFFGLTGLLSGFLDNAPTYVTFFELAASLPGEPRVAGVPETYLVAISLGAVLCGGLTYIGNGPNLMVASVAKSAGVTMPTFGGYLWWSVRYLVPVLVAMACVFLTDVWWMKLTGLVISVALLLFAGIRGFKAGRNPVPHL